LEPVLGRQLFDNIMLYVVPSAVETVRVNGALSAIDLLGTPSDAKVIELLAPLFGGVPATVRPADLVRAGYGSCDGRGDPLVALSVAAIGGS
jgi:hypothetical protein